jgi:hypothetical protein
VFEVTAAGIPAVKQRAVHNVMVALKDLHS